MSLQHDKYNLRQLVITDWQLLREIRLDALRAAPTAFGSSLAVELNRPDSEWQSRLTDSNRAYFCLFTDDGKPIGLTAVYRNTNGEAVLVASYIEAAHRGKGLSARLYEARLSWARANVFTKAVVSHRADNLISKAAIQRAGFLYTHEEEKVWADGKPGFELFYELDLASRHST